jgi:hypothetical protein
MLSDYTQTLALFVALRCLFVANLVSHGVKGTTTRHKDIMKAWISPSLNSCCDLHLGF